MNSNDPFTNLAENIRQIREMEAIRMNEAIEEFRKEELKKRATCPECGRHNLNEEQTRCWDCDPGEGGN